MNKFIESFRKEVKRILGEDYQLTDPSLYNKLDDYADDDVGMLTDEDLDFLLNGNNEDNYIRRNINFKNKK